MKQMIQTLRVYGVLTLLLGLGYPLLITGIAQFAMQGKANGSLIMKNDRVAGSALIGQEFSGPGYFHSRPSANNYDGENSGGANRGPTSRKLMEETGERITRVRRENGIASDAPVPADMVLSSASGLDPHISPDNAALQARRVARFRRISPEDLKRLIARNTDPDFLGIWGRPGVNVVKLNIALDAAGKQQ